MVLSAVTVSLGLVAVLLAIPCLMLLAESLAALWPLSASVAGSAQRRPRLAVLMPAHNEARGIGATLADLMPQLGSGDRVVVVADNCSDETAAVAQTVGAEVIERFNTTLRGKGYALDYGLSYLQADPPEIVVLMDADCAITAGSLADLATYAQRHNRPVQANYLISQAAQGSLKSFISAFAIKVKNFVRPLGLKHLGAPCLLTGTGIALPWNSAMAVNVASGHIAEDMKWGLDLAIAGHPPTFLPTVKVSSQLPGEDSAAKVQRTRWEHGHLQILQQYLPTLLLQGLRQGRLGLIALALELSILPLSLLVMVWAGTTALIALIALFTGAWLPTWIALGAGVALFAAVFFAWARFGRSDISLRQLVMIPLYILWKIPLYVAYLIRPEKRWIRTQRD